MIIESLKAMNKKLRDETGSRDGAKSPTKIVAPSEQKP